MIRISSLALALALLSFSAVVSAQAYVEGVHYTRTANASPPRRDGKIDVVEVFSYLCQHCNSFQPYVNNWHSKMPANVSFSRVPIVFQASWQAYAISYYTAETMGILEQAHGAMFTAIHRQQKRFRSMEELAEFYSQFGVDAAQFLSTAKSFAVDSKLRKGTQQTSAKGWGIRSTPTIVVAGKYSVTSSRLVSQAQIMDVVNFLVSRETTLQSPAAAASEPEPADSE